MRGRRPNNYLLEFSGPVPWTHRNPRSNLPAHEQLQKLLHKQLIRTVTAELGSVPAFHRSSCTWPSFARTRDATSPIRWPRTSSPLTSSTQSPDLKPAASAGDPASTADTHGYGSHCVRLKWNPQDPAVERTMWQILRLGGLSAEGAVSKSSSIALHCHFIHWLSLRLARSEVEGELNWGYCAVCRAAPRWWRHRHTAGDFAN